MKKDTAYYHLPGLFEFYEFYRVFLPLFREHREYFTTGARLVPSTGHLLTVSGVVDVPDSEMGVHRMYWR